MGSGASSAQTRPRSPHSSGNSSHHGNAERAVLGLLAARSNLSARAKQYRIEKEVRNHKSGGNSRVRSPVTTSPRRAPLTPPSVSDILNSRHSSPFSPKRSAPPRNGLRMPPRSDAVRRHLELKDSGNMSSSKSGSEANLSPSSFKRPHQKLSSPHNRKHRAERASRRTVAPGVMSDRRKMSRDRIRALRFSRWARRQALIHGNFVDDNDDSAVARSAMLKKNRLDGSNLSDQTIGSNCPKKTALENLPQPPAPVLALSTATSIVIRWFSAEEERIFTSRISLEYEIQCCVKPIGKSLVAPTWHILPMQPPYSHPKMKLSLRNSAKTATISCLKTFCQPLAFRIRWVCELSNDETGGSSEEDTVIKSGWSDASDWMQTSPNKPARPTTLQASSKFTSTTSIGVSWAAPQDNGAPILSYTLLAAREDGKEFTVYVGAATTIVVGEPSPAKKFAQSPLLNDLVMLPHTLIRPNPTRVRVRPGETLIFRLKATNSIGDSVASAPVALRALSSIAESSIGKTTSAREHSDESKTPSLESSSGSLVKPTTSLRCAKGHSLIFLVGRKHVCDVCGARGTSFRCSQGCDWDACMKTVEAFEKAKHEQKVKNGASSIMRKWREKAHANSILTEQRMQAERQLRTQRHHHGANPDGESKWEMPTVPTRICQLPNGWIECWDPATEHCYYHDPRSKTTQWEHPCPGLVAPTFSASDLFLGTETHQNSRQGAHVSNQTERVQDVTLNRDVKRPALPSKDAPFRQKRFKFLWHIRGTPTGSCKMLPINMSRENLVYRSFAAFQRINSEQLKLKFRITYDGEVGIDSGGLTKDWFLEIANKLVDPRYVLFRKVDSSAGSSTCFDIDPRSSVNDQHLKYFRFFGRLLSKAIYDRHLIDVNFSDMFFQRLLPGFKPSLSLLEKSDPEYFTSLRWLLDHDGNDEDFSSLDLTFSICRPAVAGVGQDEVELIPGGTKVAVTARNRHKYVERLVEWYCYKEIAPQVQALREGFHELMPIDKVGVFTSKELALLIGGKATISIEELRNVTIFKGGYDLDSEPISLFWKVLQGFDDFMRGQVLRFITGTSRIPLDGFDPCFQICQATPSNESADPTCALPCAHTCFNQLVLPPYKNDNQLREKLLFAMKESSGFHLT